MEGGHGHGPEHFTQAGLQARGQFVPGLVGEGEGADRARLRLSGLDPLRDPGGHGARLARARTGQHQGGAHSRPTDRLLFVVQAVRGVRRRSGGGRRRGRGGLLPEQVLVAPGQAAGRGGEVPEFGLAAQALQFALLEHADHAELAVVPGTFAYLSPPQPFHGQGQPAVGLGAYVLARHMEEERALVPRRADRPAVTLLHRPGGRTRAGQLGNDLGQGNGVEKVGMALRPPSLRTIRQFQHAVHDPDGEGLAADRTARASAPRFRRHHHIAFAVSVKMVFALGRKKLDRACKTPPRLQGREHRVVGELGVEQRGLAHELGRGMGVRVGDERVAVQRREAPVHERVGGKSRLQGEDLAGHVLIAFLQAVEAGMGAEHGKPGRPDVGGHVLARGRDILDDLHQVFGIEAQDGPAVGGDVADGGQLAADLIGALQIRRENERVHFAGGAVLFIDGADLRRQAETQGYVPGAKPLGYGRQGRFRITQSEKTPPVRDQLLPEHCPPLGMGKIARAHQVDALDPGPGGQLFHGQRPAGAA